MKSLAIAAATSILGNPFNSFDLNSRAFPRTKLPKHLRNNNAGKCKPHQSAKECNRRLKQGKQFDNYNPTSHYANSSATIAHPDYRFLPVFPSAMRKPIHRN